AQPQRGARRGAPPDDGGDGDPRNGPALLPPRRAPGCGGEDRLAGRQAPLPRLLVVRGLRSPGRPAGGGGSGGGERGPVADPRAVAGPRGAPPGAAGGQPAPGRGALPAAQLDEPLLDEAPATPERARLGDVCGL